MKRIFAVVFVLIVLAAFTPLGCFAEVTCTDSKDLSLRGNGGNDYTTYTLGDSCNDASIANIYISGKVSLDLNGKFLAARAVRYDNNVSCSLEIKGTGMLFVGGLIDVNGDLIISSGTVEVDGIGHGIDANGDITIESGGTVTASGDGAGIYAYGDITIESGGTVTAKATGTEGFGILADGGITIKYGGTVTATGNDRAVYGLVKNAVPGIGWEDADGTQGDTGIPVSESGQSLTSYKKVQFPAETDTVIFKVVNGAWADGTTEYKTGTLYSADGNSWTQPKDQIPAVDKSLKGNWDPDPSTATPITPGTTYTYTYKDKASVTTAPEAQDLTYSGKAQDLVTEGKAEGGTMQYAPGTSTEPTGDWSTTIPAGTDVEPYYVWYKAKGNADHNDSPAGGPVKVEIGPRSIADAKVTLSDTSFDFTGSERSVTVTSVTLGNTTLTAGTDYAVTGNLFGTDADTYTVKVTGQGNYTGTVTADWRIEPGSITGAKVTLSGTSLDFTGSEQRVTVESVTLGNTTLTAGTDYEVKDGTAGTDRGLYTVTVEGRGNYKDKAAAYWSIGLGTPVIEKIPAASAVTFGQTLADSKLTGGKAAADGNTVAGVFVWKDRTISPAVSDSGTTKYAVVFTPEDTENFAIVECEVTVEVNKADKPLTYAGTQTVETAFSTSSQTAALSAAEGGAGDVTYAIESQPDGNYFSLSGTTLTIAAGTPAGSYTVIVRAAAAGNENYNSSYKDSTVTVEVKSGVSIPAAVTGNQLTWNGEPQALVTVTGEPAGGEMQYAPGEESSAPETGWSTSIPTGTGAGTYYVWYKAVGDESHSDSPAGGPVKVVIAQKPVTVTAENNSKKPGEPDPELTASVEGTIGSDTVTYTLSRAAGDEPGTYAVTAAGEASQGNYSVSFVNGTFTISEKEPRTFTIRYDANGGTGTMAEQTVTEGTAATLTANSFTREQHTFTGWNTKADGSGTAYADQASVTPAADLELFAQWKEADKIIKPVQNTLTEVPEGLKAIGITSVSEIEQRLLLKLEVSGEPAKIEQTVFYDVILLISTDGIHWVEATEENFPDGGLWVLLNYPEGTGKDTHQFSVSHMFTVTSDRLGTIAGDVENPKFEKTEEGLRVKLAGLSPVAIAWREIEKPEETMKVPVEIDSVLQNSGSRGLPNEISEMEVTLTVTLKDGDTEVRTTEPLKLKLTKDAVPPMLDAEFEKVLEGLAPGKQPVTVSVSPKTVFGRDKIYSSEGPVEGPVKWKYELSAKGELNEKDGKIIVRIYLFWDDGSRPEEVRVVALPEDEIGAYKLRDDGTKEYLLFQTYDICMAWLGSDELCRGPERCYHK